jgi:hypothetical protein
MMVTLKGVRVNDKFRSMREICGGRPSARFALALITDAEARICVQNLDITEVRRDGYQSFVSRFFFLAPKLREFVA